jgi:exodeoxyribonuclease VII large subunit
MRMQVPITEDALSVTDLTHELKDYVGTVFGQVQVFGEVSSFTAHRSGHWYFSIKDPRSVLNCVMFRGDNARVRQQPAIGDEVLVGGSLDIYAPQGRYNLIARSVRPLGAGAQQQALEALKRRLQEEGLFDPARKRPLPGLPGTIGVATSPTGAAIRDITRVIEQRFPGRHIVLAPCRVQGVGAAAEVIAAMDRLIAHGGAEVIIVGRGGGSQEDLAAFNDEALARAIVACPIPVVSAVGHEVDVSIADLVADVRAATPSHGAELVVPERDGLVALVDELSERLISAMNRGMHARRAQLAKVVLTHPKRRIEDARLRLDELMDRLVQAGDRDQKRQANRLAKLAGELGALSPLAVLERGYSVVNNTEGVVHTVTGLSAGDTVRIRMRDGTAEAEITGVQLSV